MKKAKVISVMILFISIIIIGSMGVYAVNSIWNVKENKEEDTSINRYQNLIPIKLDNVFNRSGEYYVYFYSPECKYCKNVSKYLNVFGKNNNVYRFNRDSNKTFIDYDWNEHNKKYTKEIGNLSKKGKINYYSEYKKNEITKMFSPLDYEITIADESFVNLNPGTKVNKVYAVNVDPQINCDDYSDGHIIIPGVPFLLCLKNGKVVNYYTGDLQILNFLNIDYTTFLKKDSKKIK